MSKRHVFEEMLNSEFRWPTKGDQPFVEASEPIDNAMIAENDFTRLIHMIEGYKIAADLAVAHCNECNSERDILVYPIVFNYRQFIELSLKYQIATYGKLANIEPVWNTHKLDVLWKHFQKILDAYGTIDPDEADFTVASVIAEFSKIDPKSDAYRYPVDRNGVPLPMAFAATHLENLADVMNAVAGYFTGCDGYLSSRDSIEGV